MLSREDNDLVTQTNQGTPMGSLIRRYWVPALLSEEIPAADCPPVRVKLMGEDLVAFRDTQGHIGLLGEHTATFARSFVTRRIPLTKPMASSTPISGRAN